MVPNNPDGTPWSSTNGNRQLQKIRGECREDLRVRDERLSDGMLCEATGYKTYVDVDEGGRQTSVVSGHLRDIKHTGADLTLLVKSRWATYCSKAQDERAAMEALGDDETARAQVAMIADGAAVEETLRTASVPAKTKAKA